MPLHFRRRTAGMLVGAAVAAASLTGCSTKGLDAGTVAKVGPDTITQQEFQKALDKAYQDPIVGKSIKQAGSSYRTSYLGDLVTYQLAKQVAAEAGVSITDADIDAKLTELLGGQSIQAIQTQTAMQGDPVTADQLRMRVARTLVNAKFGEKVTGKTEQELAAGELTKLEAERAADPASYTSYSLVLAVTQDQAKAADWQAKANAGMSLQDAVVSNPDPQTAPDASGVSEESYTGADLAQSPDILMQLQAIPPGHTGVVTQGPDQSGAFTYVVTTMKSQELESDQQLQQKADDAAQQQFVTAGMTESAKEAKKIDVEINPRYGKLEVPQQGLPSVTVPTPSTFSAPKSKKPATTPTVPGVPGTTGTTG